METKNKSPFFAISGFLVALLAGLAAVFAGLGTRWEVWDFRTGLTIFRLAAYGGIAAALLSFIGFFSTMRVVLLRGFFKALVGFIIGALLVIVAWRWMEAAKSVPPIHDITTDRTDPPKLVATLPLRKNASNPPDYGGPSISEQQQKAYPDIVSLYLKASLAAVFEKALSVARKTGWNIIDANRNDGRIEAVATTFWFGFKDDVVIRIQKTDLGSRVDIRSVSRVGKSDVGANAKRIRKFLAEMKEGQP